MLLSICIPTHHGRGQYLSRAVNAMLDQIEADGLRESVEICVSDNASEDETSVEMAAAIARSAATVTYCRLPLDSGIYNFLNVVRIATGEYCWLSGSDDMPAPGSIKQAVAILADYPDCSGVSTLFEIYDREMVSVESGRPVALYPAHIEQSRQFESFKDALVQLGPSQTFMSVQIFRRALWCECIAEQPVHWVYVAPFHPHTYVIALIMKHDPRWVWSPTKLVHMRGDNGVVDGLSAGISFGHSVRVLRDMVAIWSRVAGTDRTLFRAVLRKAYRVDWSPSVVRHTKMLASHSSSDDWRMLVQFTRYLAALPDFWWGSFPALLIPQFFWKLFRSSGVLTAVKRRLSPGRGAAK